MPVKYTPRYDTSHRVGDNHHLRTCEAKGCREEDAIPYFTTRYEEVTFHGVRKKDRNKQPIWRCSKHTPRKVVNSVDGEEVTIAALRRRGRYPR